MGIETVALHVILSHWSHIAAWIATAIDVYGIIFVLALWRSIKWRPHSVEGSTITLRLCILREVSFDRANIATIRLAAPNERAAKLFCFGDSPRSVIEFKAPVTMRNLYGNTYQLIQIMISNQLTSRLI